MATGMLKVDTAQVEAIASNMEAINNKLNQTLLDCQATIKSLKSTWQGQAAESTVGAFDAFATSYFENYKEIVNAYVKFLRQNVAADYGKVEQTNIGLADSFK